MTDSKPPSNPGSGCPLPNNPQIAQARSNLLPHIESLLEQGQGFVYKDSPTGKNEQGMFKRIVLKLTFGEMHQYIHVPFDLDTEVLGTLSDGKHFPVFQIPSTHSLNPLAVAYANALIIGATIWNL